MKKFLFLFLLFSTLLSSEDKILVGIHGFMRSKSNMSLFEKEFKKFGWTVYLWSYPSEIRTIQEHGESLAKVCDFISKKHPGTPICFVTHSMGGLVLRSAVNHPLCPEEAKFGKGVLIAPPNRGTAYGRFLSKFNLFHEMSGGYAGKQLLTTEFGGFEKLGQFPSTMKMMVIAGTCGFNPTIFDYNDGKVGVDETRLLTPHEFRKVFAGHSWICHTPVTVEIAREFLERK